MAADPKWPDAILGVYRRNAEAFDRRRAKSLFERGWLERFVEALPAGAPVLSLGCGSVEPIERALFTAGRDLIEVDFSPEMLNLPGAHSHQNTCAAWAAVRVCDIGG